jgi:cation diffusion facilitator family transporter
MNSTRTLELQHNHVFLGADHERAERRTWMVITLCAAMMVLEIVGGLLFGSIALVADGLHMSTHAGALLLAALAYRYARKYANDARFTFGTGKLGDLAGFTSAIVLAMISLLIGYEALSRVFAPVPIRFGEAIPIAVLGLAVNLASVWLLNDGEHDHHGHSHGHAGHGHGHDHNDDAKTLEMSAGRLHLSLFEDGVPPVFQLRAESGLLNSTVVTVETERPDGSRQIFSMVDRGGYFESTSTIPEPHQFAAHLRVGSEIQTVTFAEGGDPHAGSHARSHRDNNMRAAIIHVVADAAVSVMVIIGLLLASVLGWLWLDPVAGLVGAGVIASWSFALIRDTGSILLDMVPDRAVAEGVRQTIEADGDTINDLHLWRLGPGHLGAILSIATQRPREPEFYRARLAARFKSLSHLTVEVCKASS